jgi:predicted transposase YbfD/YdcC
VVAHLLARQDLAGHVITADALHTTPRLAAQICAQGGDYLLPVKGNQAALRDEIAVLFRSSMGGHDRQRTKPPAPPPWTKGTDGSKPVRSKPACCSTTI